MYHLEYSQCVNPQNYRGQCVPIQLCDYLVNIVRTNQSPEARNFLSKSQCGYNGYTTFVCCPQITQLQPQPNQNSQATRAPVVMQKLIMRPQTVTQSLLPKPPSCGVDVEDRIFGGTQTTIFEFPWFALLKYSKRELNYSPKEISRFLITMQLRSRFNGPSLLMQRQFD